MPSPLDNNPFVDPILAHYREARPDALDPFRSFFSAKLTAKTSVGGVWNYDWREQTFDRATGLPKDANPRRSGGYASGAPINPALEANNNEVPVGTMVFLKQKGIVNGQTYYEFAYTPPACAAAAEALSCVAHPYDAAVAGWTGDVGFRDLPLPAAGTYLVYGKMFFSAAIHGPFAGPPDSAWPLLQARVVDSSNAAVVGSTLEAAVVPSAFGGRQGGTHGFAALHTVASPTFVRWEFRVLSDWDVSGSSAGARVLGAETDPAVLGYVKVCDGPEPVGCGSGSGSGSGSGGAVATGCCPDNPLPAALHVTVSGGGPSYAPSYIGTSGGAATWREYASGYELTVWCDNASGHWAMNFSLGPPPGEGNAFTFVSAACDPFALVFTNDASGRTYTVTP